MKILDSHALMVYLEKEPGYEKVRNILTAAAEADQPCLMTYVNWGEILYVTYREHGPAKTEEIMDLIATFPIVMVEVDGEIARQAALLKATRKMSYADCFSAALAKLKKTELVTGDKEFRAVEPDIRVLWI